MRLWSIEGNRQRLDGGAMFGNAPRALWQKWVAPDAEGRIPLSCRALLVEHRGKWLLFETGIGAFFPPRLRERYGVEEEEHVLLASLQRAANLTHEDIDVVVLSHLHFDHAGGLLAPYREGAPAELLFPKATFVVSRVAWERARAPHARDHASFIDELPRLLERSGRLEIVDQRSATLGDDIRFHFSDGHTPGLMLAEIPTSRGPMVYASDLVPGKPWMHLPITMGYDRFPEKLIDEKRALLTELLARGGWLFFTHDPDTAACRVAMEGGRFGPSEPTPVLADS
ncbi:MAG TPA: MBL fold metallo-hydrolase [Polyangiaceae bacterium]|jgi:glyoxylase-like metal-dependent hydrolase (beta-lactamase superfamily II)|nr:MBL fold metallo-hydrolase [Polyangiaceae bacterium]